MYKIENFKEMNPFEKIAITKLFDIRKRLIIIIFIVLSKDENFICLITAYYPNPAQWEADLKTIKE